MSNIAEIDRNLSAIESSFISSQPNMNIAMVKVIGNIDETILAKAVDLLMRRYPSLRRNTSTKLPPFRWKEVIKAADFKVVVNDDWQVIARDELKNQLTLGNESLLWRCTLVRSTNDSSSHVILFIYDHAIADGMSKAILTHSLLEFYNSLRKDESYSVASLPAHLSILDCQHVDSSLCINPQEVDALVQDACAHNKGWKSSLQSGFNAVSHDNNEPNGFLCINGNAMNLAKLIETSRHHQSTVGIALLTAAAWSMAKLERLHSQQKSAAPFSVDMNLDINERKRVSPALGDEHVQLFISLIPLKIQVDERDSFWQTAAKLRAYVKSKLPFTINYQAALEKLEELGEAFWKADANFSSIGKSPFSDTYEDLKIKEMHHVGSKWSPFFGRFVFLSQSVSYIGYDLVHEASDCESATNIITMWSQLTEQAGYLNAEFKFQDFLKSKVELVA